METKSRSYHSMMNMLSGYAYQIVMILLMFISRTVFIYILGVNYLGINSIFSDILNMLSLADLGFSSAMTYSFYKPIAEGDQKQIAALVGFYKKIYTVIAVAISVIGICLIPFLDYIVNVKQPIDYLNVYYILSLANVVASYLFVFKTAIIVADQRNYIINKINIITNVLKTIIQIIGLVMFKNYILYLVIAVGFTFFTNFVSSHKAEKLYPFIKEKIVLEESEKKAIFSTLRSVFVYKFSTVLLNATDNTIISIILGTTVVGYYSNYFMISNKTVQIVALLFTSLTASIGNIIVKEKSEKRYEIFFIEQTISYIVSGIVVSCFVVLVNDLVGVWLGKEFQLSIGVVLVIGLNLYLSIVLQPLWSYREATGLYVKTKWIMLYAAIINIILSILLGLKIGLAGILLASAIARLATYVWYEPMVLFREYFEVSAKKYFFTLINNGLATICITFLLLIIGSHIMVDSWIMLIIKGIFCCFFSAIVFLLIYRKSKGIKLLKNKAKAMMKNRR